MTQLFTHHLLNWFYELCSVIWAGLNSMSESECMNKSTLTNRKVSNINIKRQQNLKQYIADLTEYIVDIY